MFDLTVAPGETHDPFTGRRRKDFAFAFWPVDDHATAACRAFSILRAGIAVEGLCLPCRLIVTDVELFTPDLMIGFPVAGDADTEDRDILRSTVFPGRVGKAFADDVFNAIDLVTECSA